MTRKKSGFSQRSLSIVSLFYLLYLIATRGTEATHQALCALTGHSYPTLHRNLRLLREGCGVDIRSKRQTDNSTYFYIESWGIFTQERFLDTFREKFLDLAIEQAEEKVDV